MRGSHWSYFDSFRVSLLFIAIHLSLCLLGLKKTYRWLRLLQPRKPYPANPTRNIILDVASHVNIIARYHPVRSDCLRKSLVLQHELAKYDIKSVLVIGVRTGEGAFAVHAWLESENGLIDETEEVKYLYQQIARFN